MRTLVFDTETTGKANFKETATHPSQPYFVQLAAMLYEDRDLVQQINVIACPTNANGDVMDIEPEAASVHGISKERAISVGLPYSLVLPMFNQLLRKTDVVVAHNLQFDAMVMAAAYYRHGRAADELQRPRRICTMKSTENVLKIPGRYGKYKWPSLDEAYRALVDSDGFDGAHDAFADTTACAKVFWACIDAGHIQLTK